MPVTDLLRIPGLFLPLLTTGCSVAMALSGEPEPNFEAFEIGSSRKQVEIQLGKPVSSESLPNGKQKDTYQFVVGDAPNGSRAVLNFYYDLATLGIWELPATIIEASQGEDQETKIVYSPTDAVEAIEGYTPPPKSQAEQDAIKAQEEYSNTNREEE